jgi:hypothetical protein
MSRDIFIQPLVGAREPRVSLEFRGGKHWRDDSIQLIEYKQPRSCYQPTAD